MRIVRHQALPLSRWSNGAGRKADIATGEGWMVGIAWLDADAPFSHFEGRDRTITLVEGPGFTLDVAGTALPVDARFVPARFDSGADTRCRIAGPCRVLNAMTARDRLRHHVAIVDRAGPIMPEDAVAFVLVALSAARLGPAALAPLDAALLDGPAELTLPPGGRAAAIRIDHAR